MGGYIADFVGFKMVYFGSKFWKKCPTREGRGGGHLQSKKFHCTFTQVSAYLQTFAKKSAMLFPKRDGGGGGGGGGGGSRPFGSLPEKHPYLRRRSPLSGRSSLGQSIFRISARPFFL